MNRARKSSRKVQASLMNSRLLINAVDLVSVAPEHLDLVCQVRKKAKMEELAFRNWSVTSYDQPCSNRMNPLDLVIITYIN